MRLLSRSIALILTLLGLVLVGCSNNDESAPASQVDPAKARERVNQANQIFVPRLVALIVSQGRDTTGFNMSAATSLYREALGYDPNNLDAHFGVGVTEGITSFSDPALHTLFGKSAVSTLFQAPSSVLHQQPILSGLGSTVFGESNLNLSTFSDPMFPLKIYRTLHAVDSSRPFSFYQDILDSRLLPALSDAISHLKVVTQHPDYVFYITPQELGQDSGDSIRISLTEIYLLLAVFQAIDAGGSFLAAYGVDYDSGDSLAVFQAWQANSPFLAFRAGGAQKMKDVKSNFLGMASSIQGGITFLRTHPGSGIIMYRPEDDPQLFALMSSMDTVKSYLTVPFHIRSAGHDLTISLSNFFDNATSDFKQDFPSYTTAVQRNYSGTYDAFLIWQAGSFATWTFPNPTFNGLFPELTTDAQFKFAFGLTASNWLPYFLIRG
jgi:hypothetical protein